jgi:hypothetical protein
MKFVVEILTRGVDYPRFRQLYHSERFNLEVAAEANLVERSLQEFVTEAGGTERRRVRVVPRVNLPPVIQRLLDEDTGATILRSSTVRRAGVVRAFCADVEDGAVVVMAAMVSYSPNRTARARPAVALWN